MRSSLAILEPLQVVQRFVETKESKTHYDIPTCGKSSASQFSAALGTTTRNVYFALYQLLLAVCKLFGLFEFKLVYA